MKRLIPFGAAIAAALAVGACGGGGGGGGTAAAGSSDMVSVRQVSGLGQVLVDTSGKALYSPDQEASGKVLCSGACNAFWKPLVAGSGQPTAAAGVGKLGVIKRPDGKRQVTVNGKPLYTFTEDSGSDITGNGFTDDFGGQHFVWRVVRSGGTSSGSNSSSAGSSGGGYGGY